MLIAAHRSQSPLRVNKKVTKAGAPRRIAARPPRRPTNSRASFASPEAHNKGTVEGLMGLMHLAKNEKAKKELAAKSMALE